MSMSTSNRTTNGSGSSSTFAGLPEGLAEQVQSFVDKPGRLLIDGEWVEAVGGKTFETFNPATEESLGRVGKIMRRLLRDIAEGRTLGDVTTLRDPAVMAELAQKVAVAREQEE